LVNIMGRRVIHGSVGNTTLFTEDGPHNAGAGRKLCASWVGGACGACDVYLRSKVQI
jgi:hypothetical protein